MDDKYNTARNNPDSLGRKFVAFTTTVPDNTKVIYPEADGTCTVINEDDSQVTGLVLTKNVPLLGIPKAVASLSGPTRLIAILNN